MRELQAAQHVQAQQSYLQVLRSVSQMSIDNQVSADSEIIRLSHLHPEKSATLVALEYLGIFHHYRCDAKTVIQYLEQKYSGGSYNNFVAWYASQSCNNSSKVDPSQVQDIETHAKNISPRSGPSSPWGGSRSTYRGNGWGAR